MPILLEEVAKGGTYYVVKQRVLDRLTGGQKLTPANLRDHIQLLNEAQLLLHARGQLDISHTYGGPLFLVVSDQSVSA